MSVKNSPGTIDFPNAGEAKQSEQIMFEQVIAVIEKANIDVAIMGNKAFKDAKENNPKLHQRSSEGMALLSSPAARKAEAVKFAPYIKVDGVAELEPAITKGEVVKYFEENNLSLNNTDFSKMLEGTRAGAIPRNTDKAPRTASVAQTEQNAKGVTITKEQHQFFTLLLEAAKRVAPELINQVMEVMQQQKLKEAEERIKSELLASMGSVANLIKDVEQTIAPTEIEYSDDLRAKANRILEDAEANKKVAPYMVDAAKCVLQNKAITEEAEKRLEAVKL